MNNTRARGDDEHVFKSLSSPLKNRSVIMNKYAILFYFYLQESESLLITFKFKVLIVFQSIRPET
jgi:hypothetical protein